MRASMQNEMQKEMQKLNLRLKAPKHRLKRGNVCHISCTVNLVYISLTSAVKL